MARPVTVTRSANRPARCGARTAGRLPGSGLPRSAPRGCSAAAPASPILAYHAIEARHMLTGLTALQHDSLRRTIAVNVTIAMAALHVLGVVVLDHEADSAGLTDLGRYAIRRVRGMAQPGDPVLRMRITLVGVDGPPVWRQVVIPAGYTLDRVHGVIRPRWGGRTLTCTCYGSPTANTAPRTWTMSSRRSTRSSSGRDLVKTGDLHHYEYDFGDGRETGCRQGPAPRAARPRCTRSAPTARACQPEDCGGPAVSPTSRSCSRAAEPGTRGDARMVGEEYDPAFFDLAAANAAAGSV